MSEMEEGCEDENFMQFDKSPNDQSQNKIDVDDDKKGDINLSVGEEENYSIDVSKTETNVTDLIPDHLEHTQSKESCEGLNLVATVENDVKIENIEDVNEVEVKMEDTEMKTEVDSIDNSKDVEMKTEVDSIDNSIEAVGDNLSSHATSLNSHINKEEEIIGELSSDPRNTQLEQLLKMNEKESLTAISKAPSVSLPLCKVKRSYVCGYCNMKTTNPREYLYHLRDTHGDIIRIYECSYCIYASKTHQKLVRHTDMVHKIKLGPETDIFKKPRAKVAPTMTRSPRESKSPRRFEEYDFSEDFVEKFILSRATTNKVDQSVPPPAPRQPKPKIHCCSQCKFQTAYLQVLSKHECKFHSKQKVKFQCQKCHYATHIKARLSKHQKYHELPILTCEWCDFRTPYKWNMDRHNKNHTEDCGEFRCHLCNFTAQIKQSLTAHVTNHHLSPEQIESRERTRTLGITDMDDEIAEDEMELLRMEREEDLEALEIPAPKNVPNHFTVSKICVGNQDNESNLDNDDDELENGEPNRKKPKIKITFTKLKPSIKDNFLKESKESRKLDEDFIHPDDVVQRNGNAYVKTEKCSLCPYKAPFPGEIRRHKKNVHGIYSLKETPGVRIVKKQKSFEKLENYENIQGTKTMKYVAKLPENDSENDLEASDEVNTNNDSDEVNTYVYDESEEVDDSKEINVCEYSDEDSNSEQTIKKNDGSKWKDGFSIKDSSIKKKSSSFFDKLQEKLSMSNVQNLVCQFCGHESKCLSESVRHQKLHLSAKNIFASASLSTRCQFCRHRCKTTDDLMNHLKSCPEARKDQISDNNKNTTDDASCQSESFEGKMSGGSGEIEGKKHPMVNKVFVWNNISNASDNDDVPTTNDLSADDRSRSSSDGNVDSDDEAIDDYVNTLKSTTTQVYRCPQCSFRSTTASRFHVHMVGHYNRKPYSCSVCSYRSNWRWDITKHIKLKIPKDAVHKSAIICLSDETLIEKNYEKYDQYLTEVSRDEIHHSEGGFSMSRKGNHIKSLTETDSTGTDSAKSSPCPTPVPNGSSANRIPAPPKLTRAPNRQSSMGPNPIGPILPGVQTMSEKLSQKPPPLLAMGALAQSPHQLSKPTSNPTATELATDSTDDKVEPKNGEDDATKTSSNANYQIITPQGAMNTSLETLQLLASGSTNLARLKRQQKETGLGNDPELDAAVTNQMRLLLWLNCLVGGTKEQKEGEAAKTPEAPTGNARPNQGEQNLSNIMKLVLDHEGNPEWKCSTCDFRDNEQETVAQHVRLAHGKKGPVSLVHAVHRCSVCGFAAGTKRHVQVHIENTHNGQGGIISRSEGQNVNPGENGSNGTSPTFECHLCPFNCKKKMELKIHICHHTPRADFIFKCMFCPFYVATKNELFAHLSVHGMDIPSSKESPANSNGHEPANNQQNSEAMDDNASRQFTCDLCPFETRSRAKLMHHRQFHRPRGLPFSCPHCSYNVTRRHLLAQHLRIHGVSPTEGMDGDGATDKHHLSKVFAEDSRMARKSPSPSLTITPINSSTQLTNGVVPTSNIDPDSLPTLSNDLTKNLPDIPLVWVSRDSRFFKMFKCRHCPHVNLRKTNIQEHEKMHRTEGLAPGVGHSCQFCSYTCINAGVMSAHVKVHSGSMGKCHAIVDPALANEEQLRMLSGSSSQKSLSDKTIKKGDEKLVYYCQHCPARFFFEKEVHIHSRSHNSNVKFIHLCSNCNFGSREESQVLAHAKVHTPEYQERTRTLMSMHPSAPAFPPVANLSVPGDVSKPTFGVPMEDSDMTRAAKCSQLNGISRPWLVSSPPISSQASTGNSMPQPPPTSRFKCDQCPSTFSKQITLQYHQSLHSADNPFRCTRCTYAAKTHDGLQQHITLHDQADLEKSTANSVLSSAASSPAPSPSPSQSPQKMLETSTDSFGSNKFKSNLDQPPIKLKFIGLKGSGTSTSKSTKKQQFKYYIEEQVPLSGVELLKRKHQIEREMPKDAYLTKKESPVNKSRISRPEDKSGNPTLHYPLHIDKSSGRSREKRYKCSKCPSAFEKLDQFNVHINLHGSNYKYRCKICDYSVKFYANFMMHMKRHKYNAIMDAQRKGHAPPAEDDTIFEPYVGDNPIVEERVPVHNIQDEDSQDKENHFDFAACPEMTTAEKQQIILQQKKADAFLPKDEDKDKRIFYCQYCPYANLRRDAVDSHSLRHQANYGKGQYQCNFCDYCASGPNFIREHTKVHFRAFKYVVPEGFMKHDKLEIWSIKSGEANDNDDTPKKSLSFAHEDGTFTPKVEEFVKDSEVSEGPTSKPVETEDDPQVDNGIFVDFRSGDVVDAPNNFILPLRPTKTNRSTAPNLVSKIMKSYSKSRRARKHAKLKSSAVIVDANHVFINGSSTEASEDHEDFQEASVTIDEGSDFDNNQPTADPMCEDPLDISNHSESINENLIDATEETENNQEDQDYDMVDDSCENNEEANISEMECVPAV